jgi:hypothetical protein
MPKSIGFVSFRAALLLPFLFVSHRLGLGSGRHTPLDRIKCVLPGSWVRTSHFAFIFTMRFDMAPMQFQGTDRQPDPFTVSLCLLRYADNRHGGRAGNPGSPLIS